MGAEITQAQLYHRKPTLTLGDAHDTANLGDGYYLTCRQLESLKSLSQPSCGWGGTVRLHLVFLVSFSDMLMLLSCLLP